MLSLRFPNSGIRAKVVGHGQATCKGAAYRGQGPLAKGQPAAARASLQGAVPAARPQGLRVEALQIVARKKAAYG
ncbi:hypothetical protein GW17_00042654 [Ensete ventricosum]|nr:hypothetical protein GW17_00042654 [Ensete ventricosum]